MSRVWGNWGILFTRAWTLWLTSTKEKEFTGDGPHAEEEQGTEIRGVRGRGGVIRKAESAYMASPAYSLQLC